MIWKMVACAFCLLVLSVMSPARAETVVELIGDDHYPPYSYLEGEEAEGIYVRILEHAFKDLPDFSLKIRLVPWKRGLLLVQQGDAVGIFPPYYHPTERPFIQPYSEPILFEQVAVFCRSDLLREARPRWPGDYFGLRIGNNRGFLTPGQAFFEAVRNGEIELNEVSSAQNGLKMLIQQRVDCYVNDVQAVRWELSQMEREGLYRPGRLEIKQGAQASGEWGYVGFTNKDDGRFSYKAKLIPQLNQVIRRMKADGRIRIIVESYFQ